MKKYRMIVAPGDYKPVASLEICHEIINTVDNNIITNVVNAWLKELGFDSNITIGNGNYTLNNIVKDEDVFVVKETTKDVITALRRKESTIKYMEI